MKCGAGEGSFGLFVWKRRMKNQGTFNVQKKRKKTDWIGHILCRNCLMKHVIEGKVNGMCQRGRRHTQLLDEIKETSKTLETERGSTRSHYYVSGEFALEEPADVSQGGLRNEWLNEWIYEWMKMWMNIWMNEYMNEYINEWMCTWMFLYDRRDFLSSNKDNISCPSWASLDMRVLGYSNWKTHRHCNWDAAVVWTGSLWFPTRGDAHCCRIHLDCGICWVDSGAMPEGTAVCHLNPTCRRTYENYDPSKKQIRGLFYTVDHHFRNNMDFWNVPKLRTFALLIIAACRWQWVGSIGGMILLGEICVIIKDPVRTAQ